MHVRPRAPQIYDVAERSLLANAFAEIGVLLHLSGWQGAVRLLDYGRHDDKVILMRTCAAAPPTLPGCSPWESCHDPCSWATCAWR